MRVQVTDDSAILVENDSVGGRDATDDEARSRTFLVDDPSHAAVIYLENERDGEASTAQGLRWEFSRGALTLTLEPREKVNAVVAAGSVTLHVLRLG